MLKQRIAINTFGMNLELVLLRLELCQLSIQNRQWGISHATRREGNTQVKSHLKSTTAMHAHYQDL
jgi:hypothetical protein